jgi:hypothetical protein
VCRVRGLRADLLEIAESRAADAGERIASIARAVVEREMDDLAGYWTSRSAEPLLPSSAEADFAPSWWSAVETFSASFEWAEGL